MLNEIKAKLRSAAPIRAFEICRWLVLLIVRSISPNREKMANHWKTTDENGISCGCFGATMTRDRFMAISGDLQFSVNNGPRAKSDRAWKIREVVTMLQQTLVAGYVAPAELSFDEAMLLSRWSFNKIRVYLKEKPRSGAQAIFAL